MAGFPFSSIRKTSEGFTGRPNVSLLNRLAADCERLPRRSLIWRPAKQTQLRIPTTMQDIYSQSFSRNIGILTPEEQEKIRNSTVAIAGLGGIGGNTLIILAR